MSEVDRIRQLLAAKFSGDHARTARMMHFMGMLRTALDGMASIGVVLRVEADGLEETGVEWSEPPSPLESLTSAIELMQKASRR